MSVHSVDELNNIIQSGTSAQVLTSNGVGTVPTFQDASGVTGLPQILPNMCSLDDVSTDASFGSVFDITSTIDLGSTSDGTFWFTFQFPSTLDDTSDITLEIIYNLNGSDDSKLVTMETKYWIYGNGETPVESTPDGTNSDNISTGIGIDGTRRISTLTNIPNSALTIGETVTLKFTRKSTDTYSGIFQVISIFMGQ